MLMYHENSTIPEGSSCFIDNTHLPTAWTNTITAREMQNCRLTHEQSREASLLIMHEHFTGQMKPFFPQSKEKIPPKWLKKAMGWK